MSVVWVLLGGAIGAPLRYLLDRAVQARHEQQVPWGTFVVNVLGSLVLGVVAAATTDGPAWLATFVGTGVCGALTTFSTFSFETVRLLEQGRGRLAAAYVVLSLVVGLAAFWLGFEVSP